MVNKKRSKLTAKKSNPSEIELNKNYDNNLDENRFSNLKEDDRKKVQKSYGIEFDDDYDYLQHIAPSKFNFSYFIPVDENFEDVYEVFRPEIPVHSSENLNSKEIDIDMDDEEEFKVLDLLVNDGSDCDFGEDNELEELDYKYYESQDDIKEPQDSTNALLSLDMKMYDEEFDKLAEEYDCVDINNSSQPNNISYNEGEIKPKKSIEIDPLSVEDKKKILEKYSLEPEFSSPSDSSEESDFEQRYYFASENNESCTFIKNDMPFDSILRSSKTSFAPKVITSSSVNNNKLKENSEKKESIKNREYDIEEISLKDDSSNLDITNENKPTSFISRSEVKKMTKVLKRNRRAEKKSNTLAFKRERFVKKKQK